MPGMYFVVYLVPLKKNVVIPASWIYGIGDQLEKFINLGMNHNQWFLCYYSTNPDAFIDDQLKEPNENFEADFAIDLITKINTVQFEGVFLGNLIYFTRKYHHYPKNIFKEYFVIKCNWIS